MSVDKYVTFTARKRSLRRLCFYTCLSFCPRGEYTPKTRYTPQDQVHPPGTRYTPQTRYSSGTRYPPGNKYIPLGPGTPPRTRYTPQTRYIQQGQIPLRGASTALETRYPPPREQCMLGDMGNKWAVCILLESILVVMLVIYEKV